MEQSIIYVRSNTGQPLMPTRRHAKVWYWLRKGMARLLCREPFTIQLCFDTTAYTQPVTVGVDTGSQTVGVAALANQEVLLQAEVHLRLDVKQKVDQRRAYRRTKRSRKLRYRPVRGANRRRKAGWLPPSLRSKAQATIKAVGYVATLLPVCQVNIEVGSFDTQKMQNPEIAGPEYQQGTLQGYHVREYVLSKWHRRCCYCDATGMPLQLEHITPKARGGSDRVSNLALACEACNGKKGTQTAAEFGYPQVQAQAKRSLKDAAHVSSLKTVLVAHLREQFGPDQVRVTYGYETKYQRIQVLNLPKSHTNDAVAIACRRGSVVELSPLVLHLRCVPRGHYQLYNGKRSEHKVWAPKKVHGWKLYEVVQAKGQTGYIGGRRIKGAFVIKDPLTSKTLLEVTPRKLVRKSRPRQGWIVTHFAHEREKEERACSPA